MNVTARMDLLEQIGSALQARYTFDDLHRFFAALRIDAPKENSKSKRVFAKEVLKSTPDDILLKIADDLGLSIHPLRGAVLPPRNWKDTRLLRVFISHISKDKDKATRLKDCLEPYGIGGFVAHEDIHPTLEWQAEIERALYAMDAFIAIHTQGFSASFWTHQEIGFAVGRGVKIISLKMGEDPTGFISKRQALPRRRRTAEAANSDAIRPGIPI
jgi:TIR domain